ncbi:hypothetical protein Hanom_Chr12g01166571 [Helianthus anomalus]
MITLFVYLFRSYQVYMVGLSISGILVLYPVGVDSRKTTGTCTNRLLSWLLLSVMYLMSKASCKTTIEPEVSREAVSLFLQVRGKAVYILPYSDTTLALLLVGFTEYEYD